MNTQKKILLLFILLLSDKGYLFAQWQNISATIPSPNAASLGLYTELPVSYFTGVPNISVPLYEVKGNKISLPITLNYNASGLRPEAHPGWVGNGWSLSAGGVITRKANGQIDEYNRVGTTGEVGYYYTASQYLNNSTWSTTATENSPLLYPPLYPQLATVDADEQPDEFDFNFLGYSGKFFLDQTGAWRVQSDKNLKVTFQSSDLIYPFVYYLPTIGGSNQVSKTFGKFTITDEQGNQYIFGCINTANDTSPSTTTYNSAIEYSDAMIPNGTLTSSITATSWYLSEIISADQSETINISYERGPLESYIGFSSTDNYTSGTVPALGPLSSPVPCTSGGVGLSAMSGTIIFPVYLTKITMPSQDLEIDFSISASNELTYPSTNNVIYGGGGSGVNAYTRVYNDAGINTSPAPSDFPAPYLYDFNQLCTANANLIPYFTSANPPPAESPSIGWASNCIWLKLDNFTIKNTSGGFIEKTVSFNYNNIPTKRLQLNNVSISGKTGPAVQTYSFAYNTTALPNYLATLTDHWGFNNNNTTPLVFGTNNNFAQVRAPDPTGVQTQAENLISITYPTGGVTNFVYEPNTYGSAINRTTGVSPTAQTGIAGGLRIQQIISNDNNGNSLSKHYYYVNGYTPTATISSLPSSGVLNSLPIYNFAISGVDLNNNAFSFTSISSNPIIPLTTTGTGTHIGYSNVVEQRSDGSYTTYQFTNHDNGYHDLAPLSSFNPNTLDYYQSTSLDFERGRLYQKVDYNNLGNVVSRDSTTYSSNVTYYTNPAPVQSANAVLTFAFAVCGFNSVDAVSRTAYLLNYFPFVPISQTSTRYDLNLTGANNNISVTTNTTYDQYKNIIEQDLTNSDGNVQKVRYLYPYNFTTSSPNNPYNMMMAQNMSGKVIEKINSVVTGGAEYVTGGEVHTYQLFGNVNGVNQLYNDAVYNYESLTPVSFTIKTPSTYTGITSFGQLTLDNNYVLRQSLFYDNSGNLSSTQDNAGRTTAYLWDYNGSKPVAKVINASNVYSIPPMNNIPTTNTFSVNIPGTVGSPVIETITVPRTGNMTFTFVYNNNSAMSGNNSATFEYQLTGNNQYQSGSICTALPGCTSSCSSTPTTATISNVAPGTYVLYLEIVNMTGFQNYYGFTATVSYPTYEYFSATGQNNIAYTSFEYNVPADIAGGTGNWSGITSSNLSTNIVSNGTALTGSNYFTLTNAPLTSPALSTSQTYIVSYWSNSGGPFTVTGSQSMTTGITTPSGWTNYKHVVTNVSSLTVSGTGGIDELELYPAGSLMTTYTYEPLVGIKNINDPKQEFTGFHYDNFQRLSNITDINGNITKAYAYNYAALVTQPVITALAIASQKVIAVNYTPIANCQTALLTYTDAVTGQTGSIAGGCGGSSTITVPNDGHNYNVTVTCYTGSSSAISNPMTIYVP